MNAWPVDSAGEEANLWPYSLPLLAFDLETTGTDPYSCQIVDMALVLDDPDCKEIQTWDWLINPGIEIPLPATAIHGISTDMVREKGITTGQAVEELILALESISDVYGEVPPITIYNAAFDVPIILRASAGLIGADWTILDPMVLDKSLDTYRPGKRTLTAVSAAYGLRVRNAHRASGDCLSTVNLVRAIGKRFPAVAKTNPELLHRMQIPAYRAQMEQFIDYNRKTGDTEFTCNTSWPYDAGRIYGETNSPAYCEDYYSRKS